MVTLNFNIGLTAYQLVAVVINSAHIQTCTHPLEVLQAVSEDPQFSSEHSLSELAKENIQAFGALAYDTDYAKKFVRNELNFSTHDTERVFELVESFVEEKLK